MPNTYILPTAGVPIGTIIPFSGSEIPKGWLECDGREVSRTEYAKLFAVIGTTYGAGDGSTTFNLPNLRGRVIVGHDEEDIDFDTLGKTGGEKEHVLTIDEMPSHDHGISDSGNHTHSISSDGSHSHDIAKGCEHETGAFCAVVSVEEHDNNRAVWQYGAISSAGAHNHGGVTGSAGSHNHGGTTQSTGGGQAHNNLQPYMILKYIIKAK